MAAAWERACSLCRLSSFALCDMKGSHGSLLDLARSAKSAAAASSGQERPHVAGQKAKVGLAALRRESAATPSVEFRQVPPPDPDARTCTRVFKAFSKEAEDDSTQQAGACKVCCGACVTSLCVLVVLLWQGRLPAPQLREDSVSSRSARKEAGVRVRRHSRSQPPTFSDGSETLLREAPATRCSTSEEDCSLTRCCQDATTSCYVKHDHWAGCRTECSANGNETPDFSGWNCTVLESSPDTTTTSATSSFSERSRSGRGSPRPSAAAAAPEPFLLSSAVV